MKKSGGGGSHFTADTKGFRPLKLVSKYVSKLVRGNDQMDKGIGRTRNTIHFISSYLPTNLLTYSPKAFTMAEILLSLTIIGVVAAITLPSLTGNVNERVWNTQKKALYARFSQALALMPGLSGYGTYNSASAVDTAAETFLTDGLSKVIKINNICDATHLADCGIPTTVTTMAGTTKTFPTKLSELNSMFTSTYTNTSTGSTYTNPQKDFNTKAAAFETQNGESIAVFYNPQCQADLGETASHYTQTKMCANFVYDLNGNKGPNAVGKDIGFITALYASDPTIVAPMPLASDAKNGNSTTMAQNVASAACSSQDSESRLPNKDELTAIFCNKDLLGIASGSFWSGSVTSTTEAWLQGFNAGTRHPYSREFLANVRCVKR